MVITLRDKEPGFDPQVWAGIFLSNITSVTASVLWWSEFLVTDPEARVRFPALPE
jgi:hypothetical protein